MLDYQWVRFRFLIIYGNSPRKKSMFTFLFWFFAFFYYVRCRIFNNWFKWGRSQTMLFLGGYVNIRRFFVPCNESCPFFDFFNFFDTCRPCKKTQKKRSYAVLHVFWTPYENTMLLHDSDWGVGRDFSHADYMVPM